MNIKQDNFCSFCRNVPEKLEHLIWECNIHVVMEFWEEIERWIFTRSNYSVNVDRKRAIVGIISNKSYNKPINYILILTHYYIYKCKIYNKQLNLNTCRNELKCFFNNRKK